MSQQTTNRSFDELASGLASGTLSRGKALRLMGAALVGGALGSLGGVAAADDECKPVNKKCRHNQQCCSGNCEGGKCACQSGQVLCGGSCVSNICTPPQTFDTSSCTCCTSNGVSCTGGTQCCSGRCVFGVCLPPIGQTEAFCQCGSGTNFSLCTSVACGPTIETLVCDPLCGGLTSDFSCEIGGTRCLPPG